MRRDQFDGGSGDGLAGRAARGELGVVEGDGDAGLVQGWEGAGLEWGEGGEGKADAVAGSC